MPVQWKINFCKWRSSIHLFIILMVPSQVQRLDHLVFNWVLYSTWLPALTKNKLCLFLENCGLDFKAPLKRHDIQHDGRQHNGTQHIELSSVILVVAIRISQQPVSAARWQQVSKFYNFYLVKNHKTASNSTTTFSREKISTDWDSFDHKKIFDACLTKLKKR